MIKKIINKLNNKNKDPLANKTVTIAFLGDSITQGCFEIYKVGQKGIETIYDIENSYSTKLKKILNTFYPKVAINLINAGISGDNAVSGYNRLQRDILSYNPDLTIVCFGLNDSGKGIKAIGEYEDALSKIFKKLKEQNIVTVFMTPNMMNNTISPHIIDDLFLELAQYFKKVQTDNILEQYLEAGKKVAKEYDVLVCDCYEKWKKLSLNGVDTTSLLSNNLNHPTRDMHWLFAWSLAELILF